MITICYLNILSTLATRVMRTRRKVTGCTTANTLTGLQAGANAFTKGSATKASLPCLGGRVTVRHPLLGAVWLIPNQPVPQTRRGGTNRSKVLPPMRIGEREDHKKEEVSRLPNEVREGVRCWLTGGHNLRPCHDTFDPPGGTAKENRSRLINRCAKEIKSSLTELNVVNRGVPCGSRRQWPAHAQYTRIIVPRVHTEWRRSFSNLPNQTAPQCKKVAEGNSNPG